MDNSKPIEYRVPVAYVMGNVISVYKTEAELRELVRKDSINGIDSSAERDLFLEQYNQYIKNVVLKEYYKDLENSKKENEK